jgi:hypothetical protein
VPICVGIVGESHLVLIFQPDQPGHRIGARTVHANFAVVINGHKRKCRIDDWIGDDDVQPVNRVDRFPVRQRCSAQRVDAKLEAGAADRIHVNDILEIANVRQDEIFLVRGRGLIAFRKRNTLDPSISRSQQFVRTILTQRVTSVSAGPPLVGLYLKPPSSGGLCDGVITMPSARCSLRPRL